MPKNQLDATACSSRHYLLMCLSCADVYHFSFCLKLPQEELELELL